VSPLKYRLPAWRLLATKPYDSAASQTLSDTVWFVQIRWFSQRRLQTEKQRGHKKWPPTLAIDVSQVLLTWQLLMPKSWLMADVDASDAGVEVWSSGFWSSQLALIHNTKGPAKICSTMHSYIHLHCITETNLCSMLFHNTFVSVLAVALRPEATGPFNYRYTGSFLHCALMLIINNTWTTPPPVPYTAGTTTECLLTPTSRGEWAFLF
jgi:hypothetical protein